MNTKLKTFLSATCLITLPASLILANAKSASANTTFQCVNNTTNGGYSTIAIKSNGTRTAPLMNWKRTDFSPSGYTPDKRCLTVTNRLNGAVSQNNGLLNNLSLTSGKINNLTVVCYISQSNPGCSEGNTLFTISPTSPNFNNPGKVIQDLVNFSQTGSGTAIEETGGRSYVNLEKLVEAGFQANQNYSDTPSSQPIPSNSSAPPTVSPQVIPSTQPSNPANNGGAI